MQHLLACLPYFVSKCTDHGSGNVQAQNFLLLNDSKTRWPSQLAQALIWLSYNDASA